MLHVGPFDKEPETLMVMMNFIRKTKIGSIISISLRFRKTVPAKLKIF